MMEPMGWFWRFEPQPPDPESGVSPRPDASPWWFTNDHFSAEHISRWHLSVVPAYADFSEEER